MTINDLVNTLRKGVLGIGLILAAGCDSADNGLTPVGGCKYDSECKGNRVCINGECKEGSRNNNGNDSWTGFPDAYNSDSSSQNCTSHFKKTCSDGDLYWQDSCKNLENKLDNCNYGCSNGKCSEPGSDIPDVTNYDQSSSCNNECTNSGQAKCFGNGWKECGDYDSDPCLEWGNLSNCNSGKVCQNGECISTGCSSSEYTCNNGSCISKNYVCDGGADCSNGEDESNCEPICEDDCTNSGQTECFGNGWKECGDYNGDSCLEWGSLNNCGGNEECMGGECKSTGGYACFEIDACANECNYNDACIQACIDNGSGSAQNEFNDLYGCMLNSCSSVFGFPLSEAVCMLENCNSSYVNCFGQIEVGADICPEVWNCVNNCSSDNICSWDCIHQGTYSAQIDFLKLGACLETSCSGLSGGELNACAMNYCLWEITKCKGE